jgi:CDP-6-deoxy-D-xylo-4-hexulose-3-dehydrase
MTADRKEAIRVAMRKLTAEYFALTFPERPFVRGVSPVPVSGRVFDDREMFAVVESGLDFWLTSGRFAELFESRFAKLVGVRDARLVNSGSSANLVAVSVLTSPSLGERQLKPGDEVITVAAGFPTTVNPILQNRLVPVFADVDLSTYNVDVSQLEKAVGPRTREMVLTPRDRPALRVTAEEVERLGGTTVTHAASTAQPTFLPLINIPLEQLEAGAQIWKVPGTTVSA